MTGEDRRSRQVSKVITSHELEKKKNKVRDSNCWSMEVPDGSPCITDSQQS